MPFFAPFFTRFLTSATSRNRDYVKFVMLAKGRLYGLSSDAVASLPVDEFLQHYEEIVPAKAHLKCLCHTFSYSGREVPKVDLLPQHILDLFNWKLSVLTHGYG